MKISEGELEEPASRVGRLGCFCLPCCYHNHDRLSFLEYIWMNVWVDSGTARCFKPTL